MRLGIYYGEYFNLTAAHISSVGYSRVCFFFLIGNFFHPTYKQTLAGN